MRYEMYLNSPQPGQSFTIKLDDETMTWVSDPPGHDVAKPLTSYFTRHGPIGTAKKFRVFPGGRAQLVHVARSPR